MNKIKKVFLCLLRLHRKVLLGQDERRLLCTGQQVPWGIPLNGASGMHQLFWSQGTLVIDFGSAWGRRGGPQEEHWLLWLHANWPGDPVVLGSSWGVQPIGPGQTRTVHYWNFKDPSWRLLPAGRNERHPANLHSPRPLRAPTAKIAHMLQPTGPSQLSY